jgi:hypothetical protein
VRPVVVVPVRWAQAVRADGVRAAGLVENERHHGSRYSSNSTWLSVTHPKIGVICVGVGNSYGHPTVDALGRLHAVGTKTYWTSAGGGAAPVVGLDVIAGNTAVMVTPGAEAFSVFYGADAETYPMRGFSTTPSFAGPPIGVIDTPANMSTVAGEMPSPAGPSTTPASREWTSIARPWPANRRPRTAWSTSVPLRRLRGRALMWRGRSRSTPLSRVQAGGSWC